MVILECGQDVREVQKAGMRVERPSGLRCGQRAASGSLCSLAAAGDAPTGFGEDGSGLDGSGFANCRQTLTTTLQVMNPPQAEHDSHLHWRLTTRDEMECSFETRCKLC